MLKMASVDISNVRYDLCLDQCYRHYGAFKEAAQREVKNSSDGFRARLKQLEESFWETIQGEVANGKRQEHDATGAYRA